MLFRSFGLDMCARVRVLRLHFCTHSTPFALFVFIHFVYSHSLLFHGSPPFCPCSLLLLSFFFSFDSISSISFEHLPATFPPHIPSRPLPHPFRPRFTFVHFRSHGYYMTYYYCGPHSASLHDMASDHPPTEDWLDAVLHG